MRKSSFQREGIATLRGTLKVIRGVRVIVVFCPFCDCFHTHGWPQPNPLRANFKTHRRPHCHSNSPFVEKGYYVALLPKEKVAE